MPYIVADLDGTIAARWEPGDYEFHPKERILADAILTNQGGVPLRWCGFEWARKYPNLRQVLKRVRAGMKWSGARKALVALYHPRQEQSRLGRFLARVGQMIPLVPCPVPEGIIWLSLSPRARKPSPWGLLWLVRNVREAVFIGDEESDFKTAQNAGVEYRWVSEGQQWTSL